VNPSQLSRKGTWRTYTTADGLAGLQVEHIAEDQEGYLWFATLTGASRFDGDTFQNFTTHDGLCGDQIYALHCDRKGRLWFGTSEGACWYDGHTFHRPEGESGSSGFITYIFEDGDGLIWFAGPEVLGYCEGGDFHDLLPAYSRDTGKEHAHSYGIAQDKEGKIWFGCGTLVRYDGTEFKAFDSEDGLPESGMSSVALDRETGNLWVGARHQGIGRFDGRAFQPVPVEFEGMVRKIQPDRQGRTWFCLSGGGALCYDAGEFHHFGTRDGLAYDVVNAMYQDREGQLWFATWGGGISCYDPDSIHVFDEQDGLPQNAVSTLLEDHQGHIWMGFRPFTPRSEGVARYDGEGFEVFNAEQGVDIGRCLAMCLDRHGHLWLGGGGPNSGETGDNQGGLLRYDGQEFHRMGPEEGFEAAMVSAMAQDQKGHLYLAYLAYLAITTWVHHLICYDGQSFQTIAVSGEREWYSTNAIVETRSGDLFLAQGSVKAQTGGKGLERIKPGGELSLYTVQDGLVDNRVEDLLEDRQGILWIATLGGISRFDGERFENFTTENGLPNNCIHCVCEDAQGHLWFGTDSGVLRYDGRTFQTIRSLDIVSVSKIIQDHSGKFWFATLNGAVHYTPGHTPPAIRIQQTIADQVYPETAKIEVPASTRQLVFEYKGKSFRTLPRDMLYTCRLLGYEEEWQPPIRSMRAFYQDLPPGDYTFQVKAIDRDLNYSAPAALQLKVIPDPRDQRIDELEQRVHERTRELKEKNQALEEASRQVQEANRLKTEFLARMSHDLRTPMNAIIGYTRILLRRTKDVLEPRQYQNLENIQTSAHNLLDLINDILDLSKVEAGRVEVHPEEVNLQRLINECIAAVAPLLAPDVELNQQVENLAPVHTDPNRLRRVLMNLLGNAVKFTKSGRITLSLESVNGQVELAIADTGVGIPPEDMPHIFDEFRQVARKGSSAEEGTGLGLAIARKSIELLGGTISVQSKAGLGTTFTLRFTDYKN
jgi:signal transduction histidine kinase/ligand-binding sensor domain-containing protein